ncbi:MFS transporter [Phaeovulum vinaykumarii]|uniref:Predicted arabinose efflux permease, MFS family n=1 Tax=Phaeovulum vinaykumarii TaxID=407234 RepID=A0A1N7L5B7_9RHOB|nr:MFS transporter [Phaeovulum vinaykumarii]SIS69049.1 Predicted arabinose efflux permease, MFS family [Phaeovulum vinaykumarii]SOB99696.1 predicted MFS family arabinose efflux permease [Phaeovulum vinaykumarii]
MLSVLRSAWPLLLGVMLLMVGNGMQGTLLGIRGTAEGVDTTRMSIVMSAYFAGFLLGSQLTPRMIRRVGHVRVFAALGSLISAVLILYAAVPHWVAWALMRVLIGFSFSGVYITAESWLNAASTNENRGQALSAYMIVQMLGIVAGQALMVTGDPSGYLLFVIPSVLVSISFTPILLSVTPAPPFEQIKPLSFLKLFRASPLGCVGMFMMGGIFSALFGMAAVWGTGRGLTVGEVSAFVAAIYVGGLVFQYPIGWLSDRMDRRLLILVLSAVGTLAMLVATLTGPVFVVLLGLAMLAGGVANPLYSLLVAHSNDFLDNSDMASASAGLMFINGLGAVIGPILTGWLMERVGSDGFFLYLSGVFGLLALYAAWRTTRRPAPAVADTGAFAVLSPTASPLAVEAALEAAQVAADEVAEEQAAEERAAEERAAEERIADDPDARAPADPDRAPRSDGA